MKHKPNFGHKAVAASLVAVVGATAISAAITFSSLTTSSAATIAVVAEAAGAAQDARTLKIAEQLTGGARDNVLAQYGFKSINELNEKVETRRAETRQQVDAVTLARSSVHFSFAFFIAAVVALAFLSTRAAALLFKSAIPRKSTAA